MSKNARLFGIVLLFVVPTTVAIYALTRADQSMVSLTAPDSITSSGSAVTETISFSCTAKDQAATVTKCSIDGCDGADTSSCIGKETCSKTCTVSVSAGVNTIYTIILKAEDSKGNSDEITHDISVDTECSQHKTIIGNEPGWGLCDPKTGQQTRLVELVSSSCNHQSATEMQSCAIAPKMTKPGGYANKQITVFADNLYPHQTASGSFVSRTKTEIVDGSVALQSAGSVLCNNPDAALSCSLSVAALEVPACLGPLVARVTVQPKIYQQSGGGWDSGDNYPSQTVLSAPFSDFSSSLAGSVPSIETVSHLEHYDAVPLTMGGEVPYLQETSPNYCIEDQIHIIGADFGFERFGARVLIKGAEVARYLKWSDTEIIVTPPAISSGLWSTFCPRQHPTVGVISTMKVERASDVQVLCSDLPLCHRLCSVKTVSPISADSPLPPTPALSASFTTFTAPTSKQYLTDEEVVITGKGFGDVRDSGEFADSGASAQDLRSTAFVEFYSDEAGFVPAYSYAKWSDNEIRARAPHISFETVYGGWDSGVSAGGRPIRVCTRFGCSSDLLLGSLTPPLNKSEEEGLAVDQATPGIAFSGQIMDIHGRGFCFEKNCALPEQEARFGIWENEGTLPGVVARVFDRTDSLLRVEIPKGALSGNFVFTGFDGAKSPALYVTVGPAVFKVEPRNARKRDQVRFYGVGFRGSATDATLPAPIFNGLTPQMELWSSRGFVFPDANRRAPSRNEIRDVVPFDFFSSSERAALLASPVSFIISNWDGPFAVVDRRDLNPKPSIITPGRVVPVFCPSVGESFDFANCTTHFTDYGTHLKLEFQTALLPDSLETYAGSNVIENRTVTKPDASGISIVALFINTLYNDVETEFRSGFLPVNIFAMDDNRASAGGVILIERRSGGLDRYSIDQDTTFDYEAVNGIPRNKQCNKDDDDCADYTLLFPGETAASLGISEDKVRFFANGYATVDVVRLVGN